MATEKQVNANRENAKLGGPKTEAGKAVTKYNALKHGLTSQQVVGPEEDSESYDQFRKAIWADLQPVGVLEEELADNITVASWRMHRGVKIEQRELIYFAEKKYRFSPPNIASWQNLFRYEASSSRQFYKAISELERLQAARRNRPPTLPVTRREAESRPTGVKMGLCPKIAVSYHSPSTNWMGKFLTTNNSSPAV